jgi:hypothetical protein
MLTLTGKHKTEYTIDSEQFVVIVKKPDGKKFYIPIDDLMMIVAYIKREQMRQSLNIDDYALLGIER